MNPRYLGRGHKSTKTCALGAAKRKQYRVAAMSTITLRRQFIAYGDVLEQVEVFKYLRRLMAMDDNNAEAAQTQLCKARRA